MSVSLLSDQIFSFNSFVGETVGQARKLADLPMWLQYYPKTLFDTINRSGTGVITKKELKLFYTAFIDAGKLGDTALNALTEKSYNAMTGNGDTQLSLHMYKLSFLNFLLGKLGSHGSDLIWKLYTVDCFLFESGRQPNGPGQFMFGTVKSQSDNSAFPIDYRALNRGIFKLMFIFRRKENPSKDYTERRKDYDAIPVKLLF